MCVAIEAYRGIPGRWHTLERLDHGLAHVALDSGIRNTQGKGDVATKLTFILKEVRVIREQFPHDLIVGFLTLGVPHLLVASQGEDADGLSHLPLSFQDSRLVSKGGRRSVIRVLSAHHFWDQGHGAFPLLIASIMWVKHPS